MKLLWLCVCVCAAVRADSVVRMAQEHSVVLQKFAPEVRKFSVALADKIGANVDVTAKINDVISMTLAVQMDKLSLMNNVTGGLCCVCGSCSRSCRECGKSCCCNGSGGCSCKSCVSGVELEVSSIDSAMTAPRLWARATGEALQRRLTRLVAAHVDDTMEMCCSCKTCTRTCRACGKSCCCSGSGGCHC